MYDRVSDVWWHWRRYTVMVLNIGNTLYHWIRYFSEPIIISHGLVRKNKVYQNKYVCRVKVTLAWVQQTQARRLIKWSYCLLLWSHHHHYSFQICTCFSSLQWKNYEKYHSLNIYNWKNLLLYYFKFCVNMYCVTILFWKNKSHNILIFYYKFFFQQIIVTWILRMKIYLKL